MKKIFLILVSIFIFSKCYALEYKYSEWSPIYPGKVKDEIFIVPEVPAVPLTSVVPASPFSSA